MDVSDELARSSLRFSLGRFSFAARGGPLIFRPVTLSVKEPLPPKLDDARVGGVALTRGAFVLSTDFFLRPNGTAPLHA